MYGFLKVLLGMEAGIIMPTIHFKVPRKDMDAIHEGRIKIVTELTKFEGGYVGVNSFGFGGANSHVLLKSNLKTKANNSTSNDDLPKLVAVSGRTEEAVKIILDDVRIAMFYWLHLSLHYGLTFSQTKVYEQDIDMK
jgi:fatty acid synthase